MKAKKSLGQNFLKDENIIQIIADEISAFSNDLILEIGPGRGALTKSLVAKNTNYLAFELDKDLKIFLNSLENEKVKIIYEDILKVDINKYLNDFNYSNLFIVGNLPYYITTPIIEKIIASNLTFEKLVIMVQKEVANRFMAQVGTKDYGYFTLALKYYFDIKPVCEVKKTAFYPVPKVDSTVLRLIPRKNKLNLDTTKYREFLKICFHQKRKTLRNNLKEYDWSKINTILIKHKLLESVRAEELSEEILVEIFQAIFD